MNNEKYIGLDVHQATVVVAVRDSTGKLVMESILETEAATLLQFFAGLRGTLAVTFEEGTWAAWLYDLLKPRVDKLMVCNPRKNALLKDGHKSDRIDARKLAELLRGKQLKPVYHGETGERMLRELSRSYLTIVKDLSRVMNRLKARVRHRHRSSRGAGFALPCSLGVGTTPPLAAKWSCRRLFAAVLYWCRKPSTFSLSPIGDLFSPPRLEKCQLMLPAPVGSRRS